MRFLRSCHFSKAICLLAAALLAAPLVAAQESAAEAAGAERPFVEGTLTGDNVNVRHGAGTEYPIYYTAPMGTEVKVVGRSGQWIEIEFPAKGFSWVSADYISKIDEETGIVTGSEVNVRSGPGLQFDELYRVQANHKFKVLSVDITGDWQRVSPMPGATAWVIADYVRLSGPVPGTAAARRAPTPRVQPPTPQPGPEAPDAPVTPAKPAVAPGYYESRLIEAEQAFQDKIEKEDPADWDLENLSEMYRGIEANAADPVLKVKARARLAQLKGYDAIKARAIEIGKVDEDLEVRLKELEKQRQQETGIADRAVAAYLATGKLEKFYIDGMAGATHKLVEKDGSIAYLLKSDVMDLSAYEGNVCGVKGTFTAAPGIKVRLISVTDAAAFSTGG